MSDANALPERVTYAWLEARAACWRQRSRFQQDYPDGVAPTRAAARLAAAQGYDVDWLAQNVLRGPALHRYEAKKSEACTRCVQAFRLAGKEAEPAIRPHWLRMTDLCGETYRALDKGEIDRPTAHARSEAAVAAYREAVAPAREQEKAGREAALRAYFAECAEALADELGLPPEENTDA